jgi:membrane fusion protein, multidrug efflux system
MRCKRTVLTLSSLFFCLSSLANPQEDVTTTELAEVTSGQLDQKVVLAGELLPFQQVDLRAKVTGFVESIPVDRGSRVAKGDLIAVLRAPELEARTAEAGAQLAEAEANLAEAQARLASSESTYERLSKAAETPGAVAGNDLLRSEKTATADRARVSALTESVDAARAALASVEQMKAYLRVTAPFGGVVTERRVDVGSLTGPDANTSSLVRLEEIDHLRLVTPVPEGQVESILKGAEVSFSTAAYPEKTFTAVVARPALSISPQTRTMAVESDVDNREGRLAPGMYAEVSWPLRRDEESLFVPRDAVAETTERVFVIRVRAGKAEWVDVRRGVFQGDRVEIFGDLKPGDSVVARASDEIRPGTPVAAR